MGWKIEHFDLGLRQMPCRRSVVDFTQRLTYNALKHIAKKGKPAERRWRKATGLPPKGYDRRAAAWHGSDAFGRGIAGRFCFMKRSSEHAFVVSIQEEGFTSQADQDPRVSG